MAKVGSFGGMTFEVSAKRKLLLTGFERTESSRWNDLELSQLKPMPKFLGADLINITFQIKLKASEGIHPDRRMKILREMNRKGRADFFVLGKKSISVNRFTIRGIQEVHREIDNRGNVLSIDASITIKEHPLYPKKIKKTVSSSKKKNASNKSAKKIGTMTITVKSVHIRSGPGTNHKVLGYAMRDDKLNVKGTKNGWYSLGNGKYITANSAYSSFKKV